MSADEKRTKSTDAGQNAVPARDALLRLSLFFHRYLGSVYGGDDIDLVSISLLNEIAQHNLEPFIKGGKREFPKTAEEMKLMRGCNAFSLSQSTGVPRETVRRKVKQLVDLGWIEPHNRKGLFITSKWIDRLTGDEVAGLLVEFKAAAEQLE